MPFLRFSRDARGYESTYLCHTFRRSSGPPELRVLYWFRSPPDVKVGRAALAPDVIRDIENSNPSLRFDWDKILTVKPPPSPDPGREEREERRNRQRQSTEARQPTPSVRSGRAGPGFAALAVPAASVPPGAETPLPREAGVEVAGDSVLVESAAVSQVESTDTAEPLRHIALAVTDEEGLARLRARHAEIQTRIGDRFRDPARLEELRAQVAELDPDGWRTVDEARERIASLDATTAALRKILGRRRRSRRGGARRQGRVPDGATKSGEVGATATAESEPPPPPSADGASDGDAT
ncbi:MAG: hypothetical protein O3A25_10480 [Acidobacteria bacterium]|nr:hypothetical protein [Acidobacteriota bacterium]